MVLMKFKDPADAVAFHKEFNRKLFSSMEPETCHVVFVDRVDFRAQADMSLFAKEDGLLEVMWAGAALRKVG